MPRHAVYFVELAGSYEQEKIVACRLLVLVVWDSNSLPLEPKGYI